MGWTAFEVDWSVSGTRRIETCSASAMNDSGQPS
jgi:hypothetical protein